MSQHDRNALAKRMWARRKITRNMIWSHKSNPELRARFFADSEKLLQSCSEPGRREPVTAIIMALRDLSAIRLNRAVFNDIRNQYDLSREDFVPDMAIFAATHTTQAALPF